MWHCINTYWPTFLLQELQYRHTVWTSGCVSYISCYLDCLFQFLNDFGCLYLYFIFLLFFIIATFLHLGTLQWADLSSQLQRAMTIPWEVGGRFGSASISLCALPCGRWCLTSMVRPTFPLGIYFGAPASRDYEIASQIPQCKMGSYFYSSQSQKKVWKYSYVQDLQCFQS